jgi:hypothetical protein
MVLTGCPVIELPSADGGTEDGEGSNDTANCADGRECDDDAMGGTFPGTAGSGSGDGSATIGIDAGAGDHETDPGNLPRDGAADSFQAALDDFYSALCGCSGIALDQCTGTTADERACDAANVEAHAGAAGPWLECVAQYLREQADCVSTSACEPEALTRCDIVAQSGDEDPFTAACGAPPASLDDGAEACGHTEPMFPCASGGEVPGDALCDGASDCSDGSDEHASLCGIEPDDSFACGDGHSVPAAWVCDFEADCTSGSDEADCGTFDCGDGWFIPTDWVCDAEADCTDGVDELSCQ